MLELHTAPTSNGLRPRIMLEECGLEYALRVVDLEAGAHLRPDYLAINPLGLVPALVSTDGPDGRRTVATQSMNILAGLAHRAGKFLPKHLERDPVFWGAYWEVGTDLTGTLMAVLTIGRGDQPHAPTMDMFGRRFNRFLRVWDDRLAKREYCAGDEVTILDFALYPVLLRCRAAAPHHAEGCPEAERWFELMSARPALRRALDFDTADDDR